MSKDLLTGADLLGGRAIYCRMHPFTANELGTSFSLDKALQTGLIPVVERSADPAKTLSAYVDIYLREEIMAEGLVRNLGTFTRFLEIISYSHGAVLNVSNLARECQTGRGSVPMKHKNILVVPVEMFLKSPGEYL